MKRMTLFAAWIGLVGLPAVAQDADANAWNARDEKIGVLEATLKKYAKQIQELQGKSKCISDRECHIIGLGAPLCGFPKDYLIYSTQDAQEHKLRAKVADFNRVHRKLLDLTLSIEHCGVKPAPIGCVQHQCVPLK